MIKLFIRLEPSVISLKKLRFTAICSRSNAGYLFVFNKTYTLDLMYNSVRLYNTSIIFFSLMFLHEEKSQ